MELEEKISPQKILYKEECFAIQGAVFEVYRELGHGFLESVYQECLSREFVSRGILFVSQPDMPIVYKGELTGLTFRPDFVCFDKVLLELKSVKETNAEHRAQVINYLKVSGFRLGLLINFGNHPRATVERIIL